MVSADDAPLLAELTAMIAMWRRHWDEVGAIQRRLPRAAKDRLRALSTDLETSLAQTRHLFALEFPPEIVGQLRRRLDDALGALVELTEPAESGAAQQSAGRTAAGRALESTRLTVTIRDVVTAAESLEMHLQPIVALNRPSRAPVGFEALARFATTPYAPPNVWLDRAAEAGLQHELELSCVRAALGHLPLLPASSYLALNVSPETLMSPEFERLVADAPTGRLVVEVTEHAIVREYESLVLVIRALREHGLRLAVDDAGAGFASFRHVLELGPEIIKLDTHLIQGVSRDRNRQALVRSLVSFAEDVGATLIAEGIESREDLVTLSDARVPYGQGYLFAHPGPPPTVLRRRRAVAPGPRRSAASSVRSA